jgi:hypothetical protein
VSAAGVEAPAPGYRPHFGAVWLDGDRLEEQSWEHIQALLAPTGTFTRTWMGFSWRSGGEIRCELQRDDGYQGINVRIDVAPDLADLVRQTAVALGGGVGQT